MRPVEAVARGPVPLPQVPPHLPRQQLGHIGNAYPRGSGELGKSRQLPMKAQLQVANHNRLLVMVAGLVVIGAMVEKRGARFVQPSDQINQGPIAWDPTHAKGGRPTQESSGIFTCPEIAGTDTLEPATWVPRGADAPEAPCRTQ